MYGRQDGYSPTFGYSAQQTSAPVGGPSGYTTQGNGTVDSGYTAQQTTVVMGGGYQAQPASATSYTTYSVYAPQPQPQSYTQEVYYPTNHECCHIA